MSSAKYVKKVDYGEAFHIEQEGESKVSFARKHSRREKLLFAAVVIFVVVAIVFIVLYAMQVSMNSANSSQNKLAVCLSTDCVLISSGKFIPLHCRCNGCPHLHFVCF